MFFIGISVTTIIIGHEKSNMLKVANLLIIKGCYAVEALQRENEAEAVQHYPQIDLKNVSDEVITIVDLEGDGKFQKQLSGATFADFLLEKGLNDSIRQINFLVSDVCPFEKSLFIFAQEFSRALLVQKKKLLWEGGDLTVWLNQAERRFSA